MAKRRIRRKARKKKAPARSAASGSGRKKAQLGRKEMLARVPKNRPYLTTREVQHVFNDAHEVTIYKWVGSGMLKAYRVRARGRANVYKREDVIALVEDRFIPRPA